MSAVAGDPSNLLLLDAYLTLGWLHGCCFYISCFCAIMYLPVPCCAFHAALFHEFGHALQHMLTEVEYGLASGIRGIEVR
jgi:hypothetical protein